jgi:hypothetical protein
VNINTNLKEQNTYDAIVMGLGLAAVGLQRELTEKV